jgi:hypothetical protein
MRSQSRTHTLVTGVLASAVLALASLAFASSAAADFGFRAFDGAVNDKEGAPATQAAAHPYSATTTFTLNNQHEEGAAFRPEGGNLKDVHVALPAGFIGNPNAIPKCPYVRFTNQECPPGSQVGVAKVNFGGQLAGPEEVYNLQPPAGVPAEFAFRVLITTVHLTASVRSDGDYGMNVNLTDLSQALPVIASTLTFWGVPADPSHDSERRNPATHELGSPAYTEPRPFLRNPTECAGPLTTTIAADSWDAPGVFRPDSFVSHDNETPANAIGPSGCDLVPFDPSLSISSDSAVAGVPAGFHVDLHVPQNENPDGLAQADVKKVVVTLPQGVTASPSAAYGLSACSPAQIGLGSTAAPSCPASSKIGSVAIDTPLLEQPLDGSVYLAQQDNNPFGSLLALYLVAEGSGVIVKLPGKVDADPVTGRSRISRSISREGRRRHS